MEQGPVKYQGVNHYRVVNNYTGNVSWIWTDGLTPSSGGWIRSSELPELTDILELLYRKQKLEKIINRIHNG